LVKPQIADEVKMNSQVQFRRCHDFVDGVLIEYYVDLKEIEKYFEERTRNIKSKKNIILNKSNHNCWYCGQSLENIARDIEHQNPKCKGGTNDISNLVYSCKNCNSEKYNRNIEEYRKWKLGKDINFNGIFYGESL